VTDFYFGRAVLMLMMARIMARGFRNLVTFGLGHDVVRITIRIRQEILECLADTANQRHDDSTWLIRRLIWQTHPLVR
jgi:hypothetical protein